MGVKKNVYGTTTMRVLKNSPNNLKWVLLCIPLKNETNCKSMECVDKKADDGVLILVQKIKK
jgi:hypothetical protein